MELSIQMTSHSHACYAEEICLLIETAAAKRGTGIAKRNVEYLAAKISEGKAIIALQQQQVAGFCYIETWDHGKYVANSGLIVAPSFQGKGLAKKIKAAVLQLSRKKYPAAQIFGITTSAAVLKINSSLGYRPVTFSQLTQDPSFWQGCQSCPNQDILLRNKQQICLCTGMLAPSQHQLMAVDLSQQIIQNHEK